MRRRDAVSRDLYLYRRHSPGCAARKGRKGKRGRSVVACNCVIWIDGSGKNGNRINYSLKTRDWQRAQKRLLEEILRRDEDRPAQKLLSEAVTAFLDSTCKHIAASTRRKYANTLRHLSEFCEKRGIELLNEITPGELDQFTTQRQIGLVTANKETELLRQFFTSCIEKEWIPKNPARALKTTTPKQAQIEPYTARQIAKILAACEEFGRHPYERLRARAMVMLLHYTGLRISDVALLAKSRIRNGSISLYAAKNGKPVFLRVPEQLQRALDSVPLPKGADDDCLYFFWNGSTSKRAAVGIAERTLATVFALSGVPGARAHRFRHTLASKILANGGTEQNVADALGISPSIVRKHYAQWYEERQRKLDDLMEKVHPEAVFATNLRQTESGSVN